LYPIKGKAFAGPKIDMVLALLLMTDDRWVQLIRECISCWAKIQKNKDASFFSGGEKCSIIPSGHLSYVIILRTCSRRRKLGNGADGDSCQGRTKTKAQSLAGYVNYHGGGILNISAGQTQ